MARAKKGDATQRRMLTMWEPPPNAGDPIGVLATTFTLDTALFEEECLARFAGVQSDPARDGALYRIEREEKLANLMCAAVVSDIHHCAGRRSLRWDLLAARPESGVMHAKISVLAWQDHVRVIIGSANLTDAGYRRNQECFAALDFDDRFADSGLLIPLLAYLHEILALTNGPGRERAEKLLAWLDERFEKKAAPSRGLQRRLILVGPGRPDFFGQLNDLLPGGPPGEAHVVSPFFDPELRDGGPERRLWGVMKQRGAVAVHFHVAGEAAPESGGWRLEAPEHVLDAMPGGRADVKTLLHPIQVVDVPTDISRERRPLHAKTLALSHETWSLLVIGSSNFTSAGTGLNKYARNFEANVAYVLRTDSKEAMRRTMESRVLRGSAAVEPGQVSEFARAFDEEGEEDNVTLPLPRFFSQAVFHGVVEDHFLISLEFAGEAPVDGWHVSHEKMRLMDGAEWKVLKAKLKVELRLPCEGPPPSVLMVVWAGGDNVAEWPLNVAAPDTLPAPTELQGLSLAALLDLLSSARPLNEALRAWLRQQPNDDDTEVEQVVELVDPHAKVDTSGFLVKRVQRACWAMRELRSRLEQPVLSTSAMAWRISGPVGARAVLEAMRRQCDPELPDEWAFLLCELSREIAAVALKGAGGRPAAPDVTQLLAAFQADLSQMLAEAQKGCSSSMQGYIANALAQQPDYVQEGACHEAA